MFRSGWGFEMSLLGLKTVLPLFSPISCFYLVASSSLSFFFFISFYRREKSQLRVYQVIIGMIFLLNQCSFGFGSSAGLWIALFDRA